MAHHDQSTEILIVGGGTGGVAAALAIARSGGRCVVTEPTDWVGGQLTSQGVPPDENRWIEGDGSANGGANGRVQSATRSYLDFRASVRSWYRDHRPLTPAARANSRLNPGNGWVSDLCFDPAIGHQVLQNELASHIAAGRIEILYHCEPIAADPAGDVVRSVTFRDTQSGDETTIRAKYILDATECGDVLLLANMEYAVGAEGRTVYGELHGRTDKTDPYDQQAISWCFALEHRPGESHLIDKPADYAFWRGYVPPLDVTWPGPLFSWTVVGGEEHAARTFRWVPWPDEPRADEWEMWRYRRIVDASIYETDAAGRSPLPDVALINMVQMDYFLKPTLDVSREDQLAAFEAARQQSLCFLYWMQTEAPRHDSDSKLGYPGLKLRGDELGTTDGFAKHPYIREARRLRARTVVTEAHVGIEQRTAAGHQQDAAIPWGTGEAFFDSVGIGHYRLDLHPSTAMRNSIYVHAAPFRIPMGALIPIRVRNVLAAGKNLGVTHITNGCYRLHPVEWNVGESAGLLALHCLRSGLEPHQVHDRTDRVREFQTLLKQQGVAIAWPWEKDARL
jgi:hypothetical protein